MDIETKSILKMRNSKVIMFRAFRTDWYEKKLSKLSPNEQNRVEHIEQELKNGPFSGKPLGYEFFREKKFDGKRLIFLIYGSHKVVFLITITDKKTQQKVIDLIKANLDVYKEELNKILKSL
jgi:mRNA-degrading endonuclease RelE of RelBE toxin-antitoxin system